MRRLARSLLLGVVLYGAALPAAADGLQPYQMIRSLQLLQDRIADGDHADLAMQTRLLAIIDRRLGRAAPEDFEDPRNLRALLVYGASGGNPATLEKVISNFDLQGLYARLGKGVIHYAAGNLLEANNALKDLKPLDLDEVLGGPFALLAGSLAAPENPKRALEFFDQARLLSPGTLVEEAALRRTIDVCAQLGDAHCAARAASHYVRRFLRSPYASQFAEAFIAAVITLRDTIDLDLVEEVALAMNPEQARTIYLRIARASAIEGHERLLAFATGAAERSLGKNGQQSEPRALLYANAAAVASPDVREALAALEKIDARHLSQSDRRLLQAAKEIASQVVSRPERAFLQHASDSLDGAAAEPEHAAFVAQRMELLRDVDALVMEESR